MDRDGGGEETADSRRVQHEGLEPGGERKRAEAGEHPTAQRAWRRGEVPELVPQETARADMLAARRRRPDADGI
ncbi:hypothetical protein PMKS-003974 [Pichia membranifaciens]|uniref:Uncharacterized protein n=1 Tax=Pichia membranifaciens TaxID=4926 RepID=A0A1Q2YLP0_9ASCO|nr:hypothetical protein PMKS-003974 [Pichia membranifaciens]